MKISGLNIFLLKVRKRIRINFNSPTKFYKKLNTFHGHIDYEFLDCFTNKYALGPIQKDEALFLLGLIKVTMPKVIVEFGFADGYSSGLFIMGSSPQTLIYSFDISTRSRQIAEKYFSKFKNFRFLCKSQNEFNSNDIKNEKVDFVFIDGAHDLAINIETFNAIYPLLTDHSKIAIHDTGLWVKKFMLPEHFAVLENSKHRWVDDQKVAHQIDERLFVNWIVEKYPEFNFINFDTENSLRHGLAILSKNKSLPV